MDRDYQETRRVTRSTFDGDAEHPTAAQRPAGGLLGDGPGLPPLIQLAEQISNLRARILSAVDDLAGHTNRILGEGLAAGEGSDLGKGISAANHIKGPPALDRLFMELDSLQASVSYLEQQTVRATGLA